VYSSVKIIAGFYFMLPFELVIPKQLKSLIITDSKQYKFIFKRKHCKECYFLTRFLTNTFSY